MHQNQHSDQQTSVPAPESARTWLLGCVITMLTLVLAAILLAPYLIATDAFKQTIHALLVEKTGGQVKCEAFAIDYWPRPTIELQQVTLAIPGKVQGRVAALRVAPEYLSLMTGDLLLARLELEAPELSLYLPKPKPSKTPAVPYAFASLAQVLAKAFEPLGLMAPGLELLVRNGQVSVGRSEQLLVSIDDLDLQLSLTEDSRDSSQVNMEGGASELIIRRNGHHEAIKGFELKGHAHLESEEIGVTLDQLYSTEPALDISGALVLGPNAPGIMVNLTGSDIDVDAVRRVALGLAGDTSPSREVFDYLRGGRVSNINFVSHGETPTALADLNNILIQGQLKDGKIWIPQIELDLTDVRGDVVISEGVLQGTNMSSRLDNSTGHDGTLQIALAEGRDLFNLELMLKADLAHTHAILKRIVKVPGFNEEIGKISNLKGTGIGKLVLGDSLSNIKARVDVTDINLTADYQRVPFPIVMTRGGISFTEERVVLDSLGGTLGRSVFSGVGCTVDFKETLYLDIKAGQFKLDLDELYPWVTSFDEAKKYFEEIEQVSGLIELSSFSLVGTIGGSEEWQFEGAGALKGLSIESPRFPDLINLTHGDFILDTEELLFQNLEMTSLDADLGLSVRLKGLPQNLDQVELSVDGTLGRDAAAWLEEGLNVPESYTLRAPLNISKTKIGWQSDATTSLKGMVSIDKGPEMTIDVIHRPERLHLKQLVVKDHHSDAAIAFSRSEGEVSLSFSGTLQHETLESMFVAKQFGEGRLDGELDVKASKLGKNTAKGLLKGEGLLFPLSSGEKIKIDQLILEANGDRVKADVSSLTWKHLAWEPVRATIDFDEGKINIRVADTELCGIKSPGVLTIDGSDISLDITLEGQGLDVAGDYSCLVNQQTRMTGTLDVSGNVSSQGAAGELLGNLRGPLSMKFADGVIKQSKALSRVLEVLNVTEIVKGRLPKLSSTDFAYAIMTIQGGFEEGKMSIEKLYLDGETLDILGSGEIDLMQETVDIELLAAPFKTADTIIKYIPGVNYLLAGSLMTIPVSIKGSLAEPNVKVMSASAVGSSLLELGKRVIKSPFKLMETITPSEKGKTE